MPEVAVENARLIAAAPELLEALKAALVIDDAIDAFACNDDVRLMARAAIAKAEGHQAPSERPRTDTSDVSSGVHAQPSQIKDVASDARGWQPK